MTPAILQDVAIDLAADLGVIMVAVRDAQMSGCTDEADAAIRAAVPSLRLSVEALAAAVGIEPHMESMEHQGRTASALSGESGRGGES